MHLPWSMAGGMTTTMDTKRKKMIFILMTLRTVLMRAWIVNSRAMSSHVANLIPASCILTLMASRTMMVLLLQLLTRLIYFLSAQLTLLLLSAEFPPLCFRKAWTYPLDHSQLPRLLLFPLIHPPHPRKCRESVCIRKPLPTKTELRLKFLPPLQVRNMLRRWQSMHNGWLSLISRSNGWILRQLKTPVACTFVNNLLVLVNMPLCTEPRILLQCYCDCLPCPLWFIL